MSVITETQVLCKYMQAIEALKALPGYDEEDAAEVAEWLQGYTPAAVIGRSLRATAVKLNNRRLHVGTTTIKQHRLNDCGCRVDI